MSSVDFSTGADGSFIFTIQVGDSQFVATFPNVSRTKPEHWEGILAGTVYLSICHSTNRPGLSCHTTKG